MRLFHQRHMNAHKVRFFQQSVKLHLSCPKISLDLWPGDYGIEEGCHAEARSSFGHCIADSSCTNDAYRRVVDVSSCHHAGVPTNLPLSSSNVLVGFDNASGNSHQQCPSKVCRGVRQDFWGVCDVNSSFCSFDCCDV